MKKTTSSIVLLCLAATLLSAQTSLESGSSSGLFRNELDAAFEVAEDKAGPVFSGLEHDYLFTGLNNFTLQAFEGTGVAPFYAGIYKKGETPWAALVMLNHTGTPQHEATTFVSTNGAPAIVVNGLTTTFTNWHDSETTTKYDTKLFDSINDSILYRMKLGDMNFGVNLDVKLTDDTAINNNYSQTVDTFYNAAAAGSPLDKRTTRNQTITKKDRSGFSSSIRIGIPVFLRTGDLAHTVNAELNFAGSDLSTGSSDTSTNVAPTQVAEYTNTENEDAHHTSVLSFDANYGLSLPGLQGHKDNRHFAGANLGLDFNGADQESSMSAETFTSVAGAFVSGGKTSSTTKYSYDGTVDFRVGAHCGTRLYFNLGESIMLGGQPKFSLGFSSGADSAALTKTEAPDATIEYKGGKTITSNITTKLALPVSLRFKPDGWIFGATISSSPLIWYSSTTERKEASSSTVTTPTMTTVNAETKETSTVTTIWYTKYDNSLLLFMDLGEFVDFQIAMNSKNLFEFDRLTVQAIVALP